MDSSSGKTKLLYIVDPPLGINGGVGVLAGILIEAFSEDYEIHLLSADESSVVAGHPAGQRIASHRQWAPPRSFPSTGYLAYVRSVAEEARRSGITLAHFQTGFYNFGNRFPGLSLPKQLKRQGILSIWTNHAIITALGGYGDGWLKQTALFPIKWLGVYDQLRHTEIKIQVARYNQRRLHRLWFQRSNQNIHFYHSTLDSSADGVCERRKPVVLNIGYLSRIKRQDLLVRAFLEIAGTYPEWELHLAGGDTHDGCSEAIRWMLQSSPHGGRVTLLGHVANPEPLLRECGVYAHTSDIECLPLALQEAMHDGCPIIASKIEAHRELLGDSEAGLLFRKGSSEDLADGLSRLLGNEQFRDDLGLRARHRLASMGISRDAMIENHRRLYQRILAGEPHHRISFRPTAGHSDR